MNIVSRTITGILMIVVGFALCSIPFFVMEKVSFVALFYGIPILIIGFFILLNQTEDSIEQIKIKRR